MQLSLFAIAQQPIAFDHVWYWRPRMGEKNRKGLSCRVLIRGGRNSILVELEDGEKVVTSRYAVRRAA